MKKLAMIAVILALGVSVSFAIDGSSLASNGISFMFPFGYNVPAKKIIEDKKYDEKKNHDENKIEKEFKVSKGKTLTINLKTGAGLVIKGWDKELVSIKASIGGRDARDFKFDFNEVEGGVEITSKYAGHKDGWSSSCELEIMVPDRFNLSLYTMGGAFTLSNIEGDMTGKTMGGALALDHLKGNLDLKTMGGAVTLTDSDVDGHVETMGGPVIMENVKGNVKSHTMSGRVNWSSDTNESGEGED